MHWSQQIPCWFDLTGFVQALQGNLHCGPGLSPHSSKRSKMRTSFEFEFRMASKFLVRVKFEMPPIERVI